MMKRVIGGMPMLGVVLDRYGQIEFCNGILLEMTGWRGEEVCGRCWFETFVPESKRSRRKSEHHEAMASGVARSRFESVILARDGREISILWNAVVLRDDQGNACRLVKLGLESGEVSIDDGEDPNLKKYERIGRAAAGLAHDLNNLFFPILGYSEMILEQAPPGSELHDCATHIRLAGKRGRLLARQILSSVRSGSGTVELRELDIAALVSGFRELVQGMFGGNISLKIDAGSCTATILGDRNRLEQVLMNLVLNARDAMPAGGEITIRLSEICLERTVACHGTELPPGAYVLLSFSDSGHGMDREVLGRVFEPFYTTKENGCGIGMMNVLDIVREHGAHIQVSSSPGAGTTFRIFFKIHGQETN